MAEYPSGHVLDSGTWLLCSDLWVKTFPALANLIPHGGCIKRERVGPWTFPVLDSENFFHYPYCSISLEHLHLTYKLVSAQLWHWLHLSDTHDNARAGSDIQHHISSSFTHRLTCHVHSCMQTSTGSSTRCLSCHCTTTQCTMLPPPSKGKACLSPFIMVKGRNAFVELRVWLNVTSAARGAGCGGDGVENCWRGREMGAQRRVRGGRRLRLRLTPMKVRCGLHGGPWRALASRLDGCLLSPVVAKVISNTCSLFYFSLLYFLSFFIFSSFLSFFHLYRLSFFPSFFLGFLIFYNLFSLVHFDLYFVEIDNSLFTRFSLIILLCQQINKSKATYSHANNDILIIVFFLASDLLACGWTS